eukprot:929660-Prorocentrum_minimum.AAC.3
MAVNLRQTAITVWMLGAIGWMLGGLHALRHPPLIGRHRLPPLSVRLGAGGGEGHRPELGDDRLRAGDLARTKNVKRLLET